MKNNKILVISPIATHPISAGNRACIIAYTNLLKYLGYDVYFLLINHRSIDINDFQATKKFWDNKFLVYNASIFYNIQVRLSYLLRYKILNWYNYYIDEKYPFGLTSFVKKQCEIHSFKAVIVNYIWLSRVFNGLKNVNKILYTHDAFSYWFRKTGKVFFSTTPNQEAKALERCDTVISIQDIEKKFFQYLTTKNVVTGYCPFPNIETPYINTKRLLFFSGGNDFNYNGIMSFLENIYPTLKLDMPKLEILIGGSICKRLENAPLDKDVKLLGLFDNPYDFYKLGDIAINPVAQGSGLKIKSIEALAYGKVLISSSHSIEGIYDEKNAPVLVANDLAEYRVCIENIFCNKNQIVATKQKIHDYIDAYNHKIMDVFRNAIENDR